MKLASWNVNSLRARLSHVTDWLESEQPDFLALQETKVADENFPGEDIEEAGYQAVFAGEKGYNGVAIVSRQRFEGGIVTSLPGMDSPQRRVLAANFGNLRLINIYVPNGGTVDSEEYGQKLEWLNTLTDYLSAQLLTYPDLALVGDFNIAPTEDDVHDPMLWENRVLFSPPEREAFQRLLEVGLVDAFRLFEQKPRSFTWWDYRFRSFQRNLGLRIDHILLSSALASRCRSCRIDPEPRGWQRPSDHAPIVAEFD